ncbi:MAG TPA: Hint domain-containing protein [Rhodopila sp.]|uniref:Hint domain-containing protein n=1 Tax=Rhodopila sp. TaxID=2480087 RepID=UPI002CC50AE8|nr:Hint domain-containing protein [Rhodopila sp.]HVY17109.1 Hint domain-containing protein [Rhodopila sp.]
MATVNISNLNGAKFTELTGSEPLSVNDGITINSDGTYTVTPDSSGNLALYDTWSGTIGNPNPVDVVSYTTTVVTADSNVTFGEVQLTPTLGSGQTGTTTLAEVVAWNSSEVLLEEGTSSGGTFTPNGLYVVVGTQDISTYDKTFPTNGSITLGTTGSFAVLCFLPGTYIATPDGDRTVETLARGDLVLTASGAERPITWIGKGKVLAQRSQRTAATPVIIRKGAFAPNVPNRDLHVTKGHSFFFDDPSGEVLIPVEFLVNHRSILWDDHTSREVTVYHVELETHDLLLANGAVAESYRDDGNRWLFANANDGWLFPPKHPCAPVLTGGPVVDAIWSRLLERAGARPGARLTDEPDLHLSINGDRLDPKRGANGTYTFRLPPLDASSTIRLRSRSGAPDELGIARDPRVLGVALRLLAMRNGRRVRVVEMDDERLAEGFHDYEPGNGIRWTSGDAELPAALFADMPGGEMSLDVYLGGKTRYATALQTARAA